MVRDIAQQVAAPHQHADQAFLSVDVAQR